MIITNVTPRLDRMLKTAVANYRLGHPNETASDDALESLVLIWLEARSALVSVSGDDDEMQTVSSLATIPENLCDDAINFESLRLRPEARKIVVHYVAKNRKAFDEDEVSEELRVAYVLPFLFELGIVQSFVDRDGVVAVKAGHLINRY